ncbi:MAG: Fic family protein [bacterium]|nr:Fic family protein [bacterium]
MDDDFTYPYSEPITVFHDLRLPEPGRPVGYAALIDAYKLNVPLPHQLCAIGEHHKLITTDAWRLLTPRHAPEATLAGHLTFALKWEGVDLLVLKRLFLAVRAGGITQFVRSQPTGSYARRTWFLYEWLTGNTLDLPDASRGSFVDVLDPKRQFAVPGERSSRHRVRNNLPGTPEFCPLVFRTDTLNDFLKTDLAARAQAAIAPIRADIVARAAAFLLLEDSKSSFAIEGERPPRRRIERWGQAIGQAGRTPLDLAELLRLQRVLISDSRFVELGLREEGGFVGEHDRQTGEPIPSHISARPEDLVQLVEGLLAFASDNTRPLDPVIAATCAAFGFVYIHPFEDGNGRLHRYLIHHVLAERGFNPPGLVFPVSAVILRLIDDYRSVLESTSRPLLRLIEWEPTLKGNARVLGDTGDFYRFFDATAHAEFLYRCVQTTIDEDLPKEAAFLEAYDRFAERAQDVVEMPNNTLDLLFRFLRQNRGALSKRARSREFAKLTDGETSELERIYTEEVDSVLSDADRNS